MIFDKVLFGKKIRSIRNKVGLAQEDVSEITGISRSSLTRIETGRVNPRKDTLEVLSELYKTDLSIIYNSCFIDEFKEYDRIMKHIELAHETSNIKGINQYKKTLSDLITPETHEYCVNIIRQTICLLDASIESMQRNYETSYPFFLEGIKITIPDFDLENYSEHRYEKQELQLLMNIAVINNRIKNNKTSLEILDFCVSFFENESGLINDVLGTKIYISASYENHLNKNYEKALLYAKKGIEYNNSTRSQYAMGHLYGRKGFAEYRLGLDEYLDSFKKAIEYHRMLGQKRTEEDTIKYLKDYLGIELE